MPYHYKTIEEPRIVGFTCDCCGKVVNDTDYVEYQERFEWNHVGGYGSVWGDETVVSVVLCQECTYNLLHRYVNEDTI